MIVGIFVHWLLVRWLPHSDRPTLHSLLLMFGLWLVLQNLGYLIWGNTDRSIFTPRTLDVIHLGPIIIPTIRLFVFGAAVGCVLLLELLLNRTWFGRALRALIQNRYAGQIVGVNDQKVAGLTFGIGIGFAGLAGALLASLYSFNPDFGRPFLIRAFVIIVLGGLESVSGVAVGRTGAGPGRKFQHHLASCRLPACDFLRPAGGRAGCASRRHRQSARENPAAGMKPTRRLWQMLPRVVAASASWRFFLPSDSRPTLIRLLFITFVWVTASLGWNLLGGYAGQVSFGFAVFYGIGAYTAAMLIDRVHLYPYFAILCAGVTAAIASVLIGLPTFRLRGPYFAIATIGVSETMRVVTTNLDFTGGASGFRIMPSTRRFPPGRALLHGAGHGRCRGRHLVLDRQQQVRTWPARHQGG